MTFDVAGFESFFIESIFYRPFKFIDLNSRFTSLPQGLLLWPRTQSLHMTLCSRWNLGNGFPLTHMCAHLWGPHSCSPWGPLSTELTLDQEGSGPSSHYFQWCQLPLQPHPSSKPSATRAPPHPSRRALALPVSSSWNALSRYQVSPQAFFSEASLHTLPNSLSLSLLSAFPHRM